MMKNIVYMFVVLIVMSCNSEDANNCFQTAGIITRQDVPAQGFNRILVNRDIQLIVKQGTNYEVSIESGDHLINDISAIVVGDQLILTDNNTCNFVRDFGLTKVFVTTPTLSEIRSSTQFEILSDGILEFETLRLVSENFNFPDSFTIGDFRLELNVNTLNVVSNGLSFFYLSGRAENANINFAAGAGRFEGANLIVQNMSIFHRGSNDMVINPQQSLTGRILSTGNVISLNQPPTVAVEEVFNGRLFFQ